MFFGKKLKQLRLKYAKMGLSRFAAVIDILPSELSRIERGMAPPPSDMAWIQKIISHLKIGDYGEDELELLKLWSGPFVMQKMSENVIPVFVHDMEGKPISEEKYIDLCNYLNDMAKEHNKKADEFNKRSNK